VSKTEEEICGEPTPLIQRTMLQIFVGVLN